MSLIIERIMKTVLIVCAGVLPATTINCDWEDDELKIDWEHDRDCDDDCGGSFWWFYDDCCW